MTQSDATRLYDQFELARGEAIEATDRYSQVPDGDPRRAELWECVVRRTEFARQLLLSWLEMVEAQDAGSGTELAPQRELVLV